MSCRQLELFRLDATDGASSSAPVEGDPSTLLWVNPLEAPIYVRFGSGEPGPTGYDLVIPGESMGSWPLGPIARVAAKVDYPGAVPAGDASLQAIFTVSDATLGVFVGPLA